MPLYEHTFIARPDLTNQQAQALAETFTQLIGEQGGQVAKTEYWGLRNLAFRVRKARKGHYLHMNVDAPPAAVNELERNERINEDVIRFMTVKVEAFEEGPSAVMQARNSRDDRGGRRGDRDRGERGDRDRGDRGDRGDRDRGDRGDRDRGDRGDRGDRDRGDRGDRDRGDRGDRAERDDRPPRERSEIRA